MAARPARPETVGVPVNLKGKPLVVTPERLEQLRLAEEKRVTDAAEHERTSLGRRVASLRDEVEKALLQQTRISAELDAIERLRTGFDDLRSRTGRWNKHVLYSRHANAVATACDIRHNCGCCQDSSLEVWPYLDTQDGPVYTDPPMFWVGEAYYNGGDVPRDGWDDRMREAGISEAVIDVVAAYFRDHQPIVDDDPEDP